MMTVVIMHMGLTPNPLPAVNLPIFLYGIIFFTGANLMCIENLVMNAIKKPEQFEMSSRNSIGIQLYGATYTAVITDLMRAVTLGGQNSMIQQRLTFIYLFDMPPLQTVFAYGICLAQRQRCLHSRSFIHNLWYRILHVLVWSIVNRIQCCSVVRAK